MQAVKVYIIGVGMGNADTLTVGAQRAIEESGLLIGAKRLIEPFSCLDCEKLALIKPTDIADALDRARESGECAQASVLMSGDTGFFSGATGLLDKLEGFDVEVIPGISSVQMLSARARIPWEDARFASAHGRACDVVGLVSRNEKVMLLTGGDKKAHDLCRELERAGLGKARVVVGERLSYPDERIVDGRAEELAGMQFDNLATMLVLSEGAPREGGRLEALEPQDQAATSSVRRILIAGTHSGVGKTTFTCGLLRALERRGLAPWAFKCGPDYIDPAFHRSVTGMPSGNLDLFLMSERAVCDEVSRVGESDGRPIAVIEGVMGYYDGAGLGQTASAWDVARVVDASAVLVVDAHGKGVQSVIAEMRGFTSMQADHRIAGIVLNRCSRAYCDRIAPVVEDATGVPVLGCMPVRDDLAISSRHLGLVAPDEIEGLRARLDAVADQVELTVDVDAVIACSEGRNALAQPAAPRPIAACADREVRIAVAHDEAFWFYYDSTLRLLERLGVHIVKFSPLRDEGLPAGVSGLYIGGGYPELHARELSENEAMRESVRAAIAAGMPTIAECGGFMYLHEQLEGSDGVRYPQVGAIAGASFKTPRLSRFGYVELKAQRAGLLCDCGGKLRGHEFHYWDSDEPGDAFIAEKPDSSRSWPCCVHTPSLYAGYPHLCLHGNEEAACRFVEACALFEGERE